MITCPVWCPLTKVSQQATSSPTPTHPQYSARPVGVLANPGFRILQNLSTFEPCIPHSSQNITESQILQNKYLDFHQMDVKSLIHCTLSRSKDDLWVVMLYTNGACPSGTERKRLRQETDRWIERGRGGGEGSYLERIPKHSWMSRSGWFRIQSTKCWHVCYS